MKTILEANEKKRQDKKVKTTEAIWTYSHWTDKERDKENTGDSRTQSSEKGKNDGFSAFFVNYERIPTV